MLYRVTFLTEILIDARDERESEREYYVSPEKMEELLNLCQAVLNNPSESSQHLPTAGGFFFGNTEYNSYYLDDINQTVKVLTEALESYNQNNSDSSYYYQSSW